ncbi:uncharacterized protein ACJ7VT_011990 [Polymixia lowei]
MRTSQTRADERIHLLRLLAFLLQVFTSQSQTCTGSPHDSLSCLTDFNNNITCVWNSTHVSQHISTSKCTLKASKGIYKNSCDLLIDVSRPALRRCSLVFDDNNYFSITDKWLINLTCEPLNHTFVSITYKPACHNINFTTVTWFPEKSKVSEFNFQLQWKQEAHSWKDKVGEKNDVNVKCDPVCQVELNPDELVRGERYRARIRISASHDWAKSTWSDWSPTASWLSSIGRDKPQVPSVLEWDAMVGTIVGAVVALSLAIVLCKKDRRVWLG